MDCKLSVYSLPRSGMTPLQALDYTHEMGLRGCELLFLESAPLPTPAEAEAWRARAQALGIVIPNISIGVNLCADDGGQALEMLKAYARIAKILGAPSMMHTLYPRPAPAHGSPEEGALMARAVSRVRALWDYCASIGIAETLEEQGLVFNGCARFSQVLCQVERPVGVVLDAGNPAFVGEDALHVLERFGPRITHVHLKDYTLAADGAAPRPRNLGEGDMRVRELLQGLCAQGYAGWFSLECVKINDFDAEEARNIAWARAALAGMQG